MKSVLLIGGCGSGKTWVMKNLIKSLKLTQKGKAGLFKFVTDGKLAVLGNYDGSMFEGSDKLSMAVMSDCVKFEKVREANNLFVVCEGDRFTNKTFINTCKPHIIRIMDDGEKGRKFRNSKQSERQIKSIRTRVMNTKANVEVSGSQEALDYLKDLLCKELS